MRVANDESVGESRWDLVQLEILAKRVSFLLDEHQLVVWQIKLKGVFAALRNIL